MKHSKDILVTVDNSIAGELIISPVVDTIKRYDQEQYDHLVYYDEDEGFKLLFLGRVALAVLANSGVPEAFHDSLYESVEDAYIGWEIEIMEDTV